MQALILAAGMGKRLRDFTKDNTKCMLSVNGLRLIDRYLDILSSFNLNKVIIVVGYQAENLVNYVGDEYKGLNIEYIYNNIYDKTNNIYSLSLAKEKLIEDDTIMLESDLIFEKGMIDLLLSHPDPDLALVAKYESWMDGTMVSINEDRDIINFIPKTAFKYQDIDTYYKTVNIYKFSREFSSKYYIPFLEAYCKVMGNNEYYEEVLRVINYLHTSSLKALPIGDEKWYEIDDVQDLDIASTIFAEDKDKYPLYHKRYGGYWRFSNILDYCYLVNPFFPTERMRDEMKANFNILLENYPSGMFVNSLLASKYFGVKQNYIVVGNGAAELIKTIMEEIADDKVGIIYPTFDEYSNRLRKEQIVPFVVSSENYEYSANELIDYYSDKSIDWLLVINPDNPSGNYIPKSDIVKLAKWSSENNIRLIVDESFVDFTVDFYNNSLLHDELLEEYPNLTVIKSISKSYGVPGLRLGVLASSDTEMIDKVKSDVSIWNINSFAEFYMQIFGKYEKDYHKACSLFIKEREWFKSELDTIPYLRVFPSQANYFLCEVHDRYSAEELCQKLIEYNILISNCGRKTHMGGRNLIRIAIRGRQDNERLIAVLKTL